MRGYFLTNMYLSPIQCGIQSAHCMHDMFVTYSRARTHWDFASELLWTWAKDHKTMIVLNGGTSDDLREIFDFMMQNIEEYPFEQFREPGIDGALTCIGVVFNERMIEGMKYVRENPHNETCCVYKDADEPSDDVVRFYVNPQYSVAAEQQGVREETLLPHNMEPAYSEAEWQLCRMLAHKSLA